MAQFEAHRVTARKHGCHTCAVANEGIHDSPNVKPAHMTVYAQ